MKLSRAFGAVAGAVVMSVVAGCGGNTFSFPAGLDAGITVGTSGATSGSAGSGVSAGSGSGASAGSGAGAGAESGASAGAESGASAGAESGASAGAESGASAGASAGAASGVASTGATGSSGGGSGASSGMVGSSGATSGATSGSGGSGMATTGESSGATSGSSGASGGSSGGSSGSPSACPMAAPTAGADCPRVGLECEYGTSPELACNQLADCTAMGWTVTDGTTGCVTGSCPKRYAGITNGGVCMDPGLVCAYADGTCNCAVQAGPIRPGGLDRWACFDVAQGCPSPRPNIGDPCPTDGTTCNYGVCSGGFELVCRDGIWQEGPHAPCAL